MTIEMGKIGQYCDSNILIINSLYFSKYQIQYKTIFNSPHLILFENIRDFDG